MRQLSFQHNFGGHGCCCRKGLPFAFDSITIMDNNITIAGNTQEETRMNDKTHAGNAADPRIGFFDALAVTWDNEEPSSQMMTARLAQHADLLALRAGDELLEVGCGTGKTTAWLAAQVAPGRVTAIDFAPAMIAAAKAKGIDADFACRDVCHDRLGCGRYDVILCFHSFPHFRDQAAALRNFTQSLKPGPGGRLIVIAPGRQRAHQPLPRRHRWSRQGRRAAGRQGLGTPALSSGIAPEATYRPCGPVLPGGRHRQSTVLKAGQGVARIDAIASRDTTPPWPCQAGPLVVAHAPSRGLLNRDELSEQGFGRYV